MQIIYRQLLQGLALLFLSTSVMAANFVVGPVRATLSNQHKVDTLTVTNQSKESSTIQIELMSWSQDAMGKDVLEPTKDILVAPPVFTVAGGSKQVIRLGLRKPITASVEQTYRLILKEVPPPPKPNFTGLSMALNISIPVFVVPSAPVNADLVWHLKNTSDGLILSAVNNGSAHSQVKEISLVVDETNLPTEKMLAKYILQTKQQEWLFKGQHLERGKQVKLKAKTDSNTVEADLVVEE